MLARASSNLSGGQDKRVRSQRSESVVKSTSCIVRHRYQETTSEDIEDLMSAVVIYSVCRLVNVL
jgi:hypothetical protein